MTESIKATRASVQIGSLEVDGFMLPDGVYLQKICGYKFWLGKLKNFLQKNLLRFLTQMETRIKMSSEAIANDPI